MESLLWAIDLCAVVYLCLWALKTDKRKTKEAEQAAALGDQPEPHGDGDRRAHV